MTTLKAQVQNAAAQCGDDPATIDCFSRPLLPDAGDGMYRSESFGPQVRCDFENLPDREFDAGYGSPEGEPFIGFSKDFVYIRAVYDGSEWVEAIPRHPDRMLRRGWFPEVGGG